MKSDFLKVFNFLYHSGINFEMVHACIGKMWTTKISIHDADSRIMEIDFDYVYDRIIITLNSISFRSESFIKGEDSGKEAINEIKLFLGFLGYRTKKNPKTKAKKKTLNKSPHKKR